MPLLGYIPAGSTNDFATSLGIPKRMPLAAWDIVEGTPFAIDTGTFCEDMNFMYIAAFGAFTEVSYLTSQDRKNLLGHQAYMLEGVKSLAGLKPYHMKVEWDGQVLEDNLRWCGKDRAWLERTATANTVLPQEILLLIGNETEDYFLLKKEGRQPGGKR